MTFDTNVLVWYLRGNVRAEAFVSGVPFDRRWLSAMVYFELLQGCTSPKEVRTLRKFVGKNFSRVVPISEQISHRAGTLLERHAVSHGLRAADALIAATSLVAGKSFSTSNLAHFRHIPGLRLVSFTP